MTVPAEPTVDKLSIHGGISTDNVFDGACSNMAIMGSACSERRAIVERKLGEVLRALELFLETVLGLPRGEHTAFFLGETRPFRYWVEAGKL